MDNSQTMELTDRVTTALLEDPVTKNAQIDVMNERGIVTLKGTVDKENIRQTAEMIARKQAGVITVINEIKVS